MAPVKNATDEMNENVPKLLCQMDNHLGVHNNKASVTHNLTYS